MFENFPYSNFHDLNTDWIVKKIKDVETSEANAKASEENAKASELNASLSDASAQTWALQANNSAKRASEQANASAQSAAEADNYVTSTRDQVNLLQSRVDNIIPSGTQTEGNTELLDIRVAEDGQIYDSAGNAVRGQVRDLKNVIDPLTQWKSGSGTNDFVFIKFNVTPNKRYLIKNTSATGTIGVATTQTDSTSESKTEGTWNLSYESEIYIVPTLSANYFRVYCNGTNVSFEIYDTTTQIHVIENTIKSVGIQTWVHVALTDNSFWNCETDTAVIQSFTGTYKSGSLAVSEGEKYSIQINNGTSSRQCAILLTDDDNKIISFYPRGRENKQFTQKITIPNGVTKLLFTHQQSTDSNIFAVFKIENGELINSVFNGKYCSVMGDSFSAYTGTIPNGNRVYYKGSNSGVVNAGQMWWSVLCDALQMTPLVINGWSGSCVTYGVRDESDYKSSSDSSRCSLLGTDDIDPDVIIVAMGLNDYSYNATLGTWDGTTVLNNDVSTFRTAYATMLERIQTNYPNALIVCVTPWFSQRGTDVGSTYINTSGLTEVSYINAVKEISELMGCPVIDASSIGFNRYNYYPHFCEDSQTTPTHPNANGQKAIGLTIADALKNMCSGFVKYAD